MTRFPFNDTSLPLEKRIDDLLSRLSLDEKISLIPTRQAAVPRLGIRAFNVGGEGAHGFVDRHGETTTFPQTIALASTWDRALLSKVGATIGTEARAYFNRGNAGGLALWFPTIDMERDPRWGRTEEGYGEDPFLSSELAASVARGAQGCDPFYERVSCAPKHFFANNNEARRESCSASVPQRAAREYYLEVFRRFFERSGARSMMTSYNAVNGVPMTVNPIVKSFVKGECAVGGRGYVVCDGGAVSLVRSAHRRFESDAETVAAAILAGVDCLTDSPSVVIPALKEALSRKLLREGDIDESLRSILRAEFHLGLFDDECPYNSIGEESMMTEESAALSREACAQSIVLLKNSGALPMPPRGDLKVAVVGPLADRVFCDWYSGVPPYRVTPLDALKKIYGDGNVVFESGRDDVSFMTMDGRPVVVGERSRLMAGGAGERAEIFARDDWGWGANVLWSEKFSRAIQSVYDIPFDHQPSEEEMAALRAAGGSLKGRMECSSRSTLSWFVTSLINIIPSGCQGEVVLRTWNGRTVASASEGFVDSDESESEKFKMTVERDGIAEAVRAASRADVAIVFCGSDPMINGKEDVDRPSLALPERQRALVRAVSAAAKKTVLVMVSGYPYAAGEEIALSDAALWMGHGMQEEGNAVADVISGAVSPSARLPMTWYKSERDLPDMMEYDIARSRATYRYFDGEPLFPFGHGLSYSRFDYSELKIDADESHGFRAVVSFVVSNVGGRDAAEVAQLYVAATGGAERPKKALAGFERIFLRAGESRRVEFSVDARDISVWSPGCGRMVCPSCECVFMAGSSSADIRLSAARHVKGETVPPRAIEAIEAWSFDSSENCVLEERPGFSAPAVAAADARRSARILYRACGFGGGAFAFKAAASAEGACSLSLSIGGAPAAEIALPVTGNVCRVPGKSPPPCWALVGSRVQTAPGVCDVEVALRGKCAIHSIGFEKALKS